MIDLGDRTVSVGTRPDWLLEPVSGKRAEAIHWSRIAFLDSRLAGDCKFTWELNRHQYFLTLARGYLLTGDDRYASLIFGHLSSWMDDNPPQIGINWASSLELALRAISWIWTVHLVRNAPALDGDMFVRVLKQLYLHARHIERYLSTYFSPNTHLTGEALALLYIGSAFPDFTRASHWRALGHRILVEQLEKQLFADGVYFEQSTYYHRYTTDFCLHALLLTKSGGGGLDPRMCAKLDVLLGYLMHIMRPDGTSPLVGDDDGGRLVMLGERRANDFRDTLAIGAALLQRAEYAFVAGNEIEELIWVLGPDGVESYRRLSPTPPSECSHAFVDSGYFITRDRWDSAADWMLVRCGPHARRTGAHAHADALSLELSVRGQPTIVDPGTYVYTGSRAEREYFRGTLAHNTLAVDGTSSAEPAESPFKWRSVPHSRALTWVTNRRFDFFEGEHDGYQRLEAPALHMRAVFALKGDYWVIRDRIRSNGKHHLAVHWHFSPGVTVRTQGNALTAHIADAEALLTARIFARSGELSCEQGWVSTAYGTRSPATIAVFRENSDGAEEIFTVLANAVASERAPDIKWCAATSQHSGVLTIVTGSSADTILTGPANAENETGVISDAEWTWVRRSRSGQLLGFAVVRGTQLVIDEHRVLHVGSLAECAVGRREPDGFRVELEGPHGSQSSSPSADERSEVPCVVFAE